MERMRINENGFSKDEQLRNIAAAVADILTDGKSRELGFGVSNVTLRVSRDGSVFATTIMKVSGYFRPESRICE